MDNQLTDHIEREAQQAYANREELVDRIARAVAKDGSVEPMPGVILRRTSVPTEPCHAVAEPAFCVIAQGSKEIWLGEERFRYDPYHYLLATLDLPAVSQIAEASTERPFLSFRLDLDPALVSSVMVEAGHLPRGTARARGR